MRKVILVLGLFVTMVFAQDLEHEISELIHRVKSAPPEERYKVMNELKTKLREMSERERHSAIEKVYRELKGERHEGREEHEHVDRDHEDRYGEKHEEKYEEKHGEKYEEKYGDMYEKYEEKNGEMMDKETDEDRGGGSMDDDNRRRRFNKDD